MTYRNFLELSGVGDLYDVGEWFFNQGKRAMSFPDASILEEGTEDALFLDTEGWDEAIASFQEKITETGQYEKEVNDWHK